MKRKIAVLLALAISTVLNASYYIRAIRCIYSKGTDSPAHHRISRSYNLGMGIFIVANVALGLFYQNIVDIIALGLNFF